MTACTNPWPCVRTDPHEGGTTGHGCVHYAAWAPDPLHIDGWSDQ